MTYDNMLYKFTFTVIQFNVVICFSAEQIVSCTMYVCTL